MPIRTSIKIIETDGDDVKTVVPLTLIDTTSTGTVNYLNTYSASPTGVTMPMGPITKADIIYIQTNTPITLQNNGKAVSDPVDHVYMLVGGSVTGLIMTAASGATVRVYLAGT